MSSSVNQWSKVCMEQKKREKVKETRITAGQTPTQATANDRLRG